MASGAFKPSIRRTILAASIAVAGAIAVATPAGAAAVTDGTSNTIMFAATSVRLDEPHKQAVVSAPAVGAMAAGARFDTVEVATPRSVVKLTDVPVTGMVGRDHRSLALNFTEVKFMDYTDDACTLEATACHLVEDGIHDLARAVAGGQEGEE